ncbi:uncharacterized protein LOC141851362 [Brevipalpus obovatus]|uniref:uncharacterized protein LOC141851362 n=1 Tax=Brevipalpus obovatus TaxID=246614 RepID=UPI003D9F5523
MPIERERTSTTFTVKKLISVVVVCIIIAVIVLTVYFATSEGHHSDEDNSCPKVVEYDFDALSLRWNPTLCNDEKCIRRSDKWEIHGLWQDYKNGSYPSYCCNSSKFDLELIEPLLLKLNESWPNQWESEPEDSLWKHEWMKHGTCSSIGIKEGQFGYFNRTLHLFDEYPIQEWLEKAGIKPTVTEKQFAYDKDKFHEAIESQLGHRITLSCKKKFNSKILIDTLFVCFKYPGSNLYDCPLKDGCDEKVILPKTINPDIRA